MKITLNHRYRGVLTGEKWIEPGQYEDNDPALFGMDVQYLIDNGHAVEVLPSIKSVKSEDAPLVSDVEETALPDDTTMQVQPEGDSPSEFSGVIGIPHDISDMSLPELIKQLELRGIDQDAVVDDIETHWKTRRREIIAYLESLEDTE